MVDLAGAPTALPPGQVLGLAYRANSAVARVPLERRLSTVEAIVSRLVTNRSALEGRIEPAIAG